MSGGRPSEIGCYQNANLLYDWLVNGNGVDPKNITVVGYSIGTGPAIELAATHKVGALVLAAPFLSVTKIWPGKVFDFHGRLFFQDIFLNEKKAVLLKAPCVVFHGTEDRVMPYEGGRRLYDSIPLNRKQFVPVEGAGHYNLPDKIGRDDYSQILLNARNLPEGACKVCH